MTQFLNSDEVTKDDASKAMEDEIFEESEVSEGVIHTVTEVASGMVKSVAKGAKAFLAPASMIVNATRAGQNTLDDEPGQAAAETDFQQINPVISTIKADANKDERRMAGQLADSNKTSGANKLAKVVSQAEAIQSAVGPLSVNSSGTMSSLDARHDFNKSLQDLDPQQQAQFKRQLLKPGLVALSMDSVVLYTLYILLIDWSGHTPESTNDLALNGWLTKISKSNKGSQWNGVKNLRGPQKSVTIKGLMTESRNSWLMCEFVGH